MSDLYDTDFIACDAKMKEDFDRIEAWLDRTTARSDRIRKCCSRSANISAAPAAGAFWEEAHPCPMNGATSTSKP